MDRLQKLWDWLSNTEKQRTLKFIGGGIVAVVAGTWAFFTYFHSNQTTEKTSHIASTKIQQVTGGAVHTGSGNQIITNVHGISEETALRIAGELGITRAALTSFFKILEQKNVAPEDLDSTLREIAKRYNEIKERLRLFSSDDPEVTALKHQAAEALDVGNFDRAESLLNKAKYQDIHAAKEMQDMAEKRFLSAASSAAEIGDLKYSQLAYAEAAEYYREAAELVPPREEKVLADYLNSWGHSLINAGNYAEPEEPLSRSLAIREKALGPNHPHVAASLNNLALLYHEQGQYTEAEPLYKRALEIREKTLGPDHPDVAESLNNLAGLYDSQGQYTEAEPPYKRALEIWEKTLGPDHPHVAAALNNLALLYHEQGQYTEAEPPYKRGLEILEKALGPDHPDVATIRDNLLDLQEEISKETAPPTSKS